MCWNKELRLGLTIALLLPAVVMALVTDRQQPLQIQANTATIEDAKGIAIYEGSVVVTQGSIMIEADKVTLNYTQKQDIDKVVAEGNPARFKQTPEGGKEDIKAKALRMEYNAIANMLHLTKEAEVRQGNDTFTGPHIMYDTQQGIIRAEKGESKEQITVIIQPRSAKPSVSDDKTEKPNRNKKP